MTLKELEDKLSYMSRSSTCNVEPKEAAQMLAALQEHRLALDQATGFLVEAFRRENHTPTRARIGYVLDQLAKAGAYVP